MPDFRYVSQNISEFILNYSARTFGQELVDVPRGRYVSLCFDDFPKSAVQTAAPMIEARGWRATWYACGAMMGQRSDEYGAMYTAQDLKSLSAKGHEIGCHTYSHQSAQDLSKAELIEDCLRNGLFFKRYGIAPPRSFAFPFGAANLSAKSTIAETYTAARGVYPGTNTGKMDIRMLMATALQDDQGGIDRALTELENLTDEGSWLIIFTHDVETHHSPWGVAPEDYETVLEAIEASGAEVITVADMIKRVRPERSGAINLKRA
ncbi:MAG: polysaccharide deacetylase family protein [Pseudomonadota bacterium]